MNGTRHVAVRFDGRTATATPVTVQLESGRLVVRAEHGAALDSLPIEDALISEGFVNAPRLLELPDGATLQVPDPERAFDAALRAAGLRDAPVVRLQRHGPAVALALLLLLATLLAGYFRGVPAAARAIAFALPPALEERMGEQLLSVLDRAWLQPSLLPESERAAIAARFEQAAITSGVAQSSRLVFRASKDPRSGVNAFTLPGGVIILLDGLVRLADDHDVVLAVLGHELGHVAHKHVTRRILQSTGTGAIASLMWGDFSGVASGVPVVLGMLQYSRDFEREADDHALSVLHASGLSAEPLDRLFRRLAEQSQEHLLRPPAFLSTHPSTAERRERLAGMQH